MIRSDRHAGARQRLRRELARLGAPRAAVTVEAVSPMLAEARERPFTAAGWLFELKYDGYRVLAERSAAGAVRLLYRSGRDATALFPELARAVAALPFTSLVLDGEAVALDAAGRPSFGLLQRRMHVSDPATAHQQAIIALGNAVKRQALVMGFSDAFAVVGVVLVISGIAILLAGKPKGGAAAGGGH